MFATSINDGMVSHCLVLFSSVKFEQHFLIFLRKLNLFVLASVLIDHARVELSVAENGATQSDWIVPVV